MKTKNEVRIKREINKLTEAVRHLEKGRMVLERVNQESENYKKGYSTIYQSYIHKLDDLFGADNGVEMGLKVYIRMLKKKVGGPKVYDHKGIKVTIPTD